MNIIIIRDWNICRWEIFLRERGAVQILKKQLNEGKEGNGGLRFGNREGR